MSGAHLQEVGIENGSYSVVIVRQCRRSTALASSWRLRCGERAVGSESHHRVGGAGLAHLAKEENEATDELQTGPTWVDDDMMWLQHTRNQKRS